VTRKEEQVFVVHLSWQNDRVHSLKWWSVDGCDKRKVQRADKPDRWGFIEASISATAVAYLASSAILGLHNAPGPFIRIDPDLRDEH
jgi:hypothetical protein